MSYYYGKTSKSRLETCDPRIQEIMNEVIKYMDVSILCGHRGEKEQNEAYYADPQLSKVKYPNSKHNKNPSLACDAAPYPIDWNDTRRFGYMMGLIKGIAMMKGYKIRTGIDWDSDGDITDHKFMDWPHFELVD